jgi:multicomponent Na+:H+ antiporter subunit D
MNILIAFVAGMLCVAVATFAFQRRAFFCRAISITGAVILWFLSLGILGMVWMGDRPIVLELGGWPPPFGIVLVADLLSAVMVAVSHTVFVAVCVFSLATIGYPRERHHFWPLVWLVMMGVNMSFLTGDIFNLFVGFEVMLNASYVLMALGSGREQIRETVKYMAINLAVSMIVFIPALAVTYLGFGTLNMADLAVKIRAFPNAPLVPILAGMYLLVFGTKAAIFPLFAWLPGPYFTAPAGITALFGGLLTKVGVYAIFRVFTLIFRDIPIFSDMLLIAAGCTMIIGVLFAISQEDMKRILSYHIISQIGYMMLGIGIGTPLAYAGAIFYIVHHVIVKSNLFLIAGAVRELMGSTRLGDLGGLYGKYPVLAGLFLVSALGLAGVPPLSGFWAKFVLFRAGIAQGEYAYVVVGLLCSFLTLLSMVKIGVRVFWHEEKTPPQENVLSVGALLPGVVFLAAFTVSIGVFPSLLYAIAYRAGEYAGNPDIYINAVLRGGL